VIVTQNYLKDLNLYTLEKSDLVYFKDKDMKREYCRLKENANEFIFEVRGKIFVYTGKNKVHISYIPNELYDHILTYKHRRRIQPEDKTFEGIKEYVIHTYEDWKSGVDFKNFLDTEYDFLKSGLEMGDMRLFKPSLNTINDMYYIYDYLDIDELTKIRDTQKEQLPDLVNIRLNKLKEDFQDKQEYSEAKRHLLIQQIDVLKMIFDTPIEPFNDIKDKKQLFIDALIPFSGKFTYSDILDYRKRFLKYADMRGVNFDSIKYHDKAKKLNPLTFRRIYLGSLYVHPLLEIKSLHKYYKFLLKLQDEDLSKQEIDKQGSDLFYKECLKLLKNEIKCDLADFKLIGSLSKSKEPIYWYGNKIAFLTIYNIIFGISSKNQRDLSKILSSSIVNDEGETIKFSTERISTAANRKKEEYSDEELKIFNAKKKLIQT